MGLEPTSDLVAACFRDKFLIQPDDFRNCSAAEVGIEPTPRRSERPILPLDDPAVIVRFHPSCGDRNRTCVSWFKARHRYQQRLPRNAGVRHQFSCFSSSGLTPSASGSPANRTQRDPVISRIQATSLRLPAPSGTSESNTPEAEPKTEPLPPAPKAGVLPSVPRPECSQSERQDSNLRTPGPRPGAITKLRHVLIVCTHRER